MRSDLLTCDDVAPLLGDVAEGAAIGDLAARRHVESCLRCQADLVQYRRLLRMMRSLRSEMLVPAPGMLSDLLASLAESGERHAVRSMLGGRRGAYLGGLAAATAAGAAGALVLATRSRRRVPLAS